MVICIVCNINDTKCKNMCKKCYMIEYRKTDKEIKRTRKYDWKKSGLIDSHNDNYETIYQRYIDTTNCDLCNVQLTKKKITTSTTKCMEHNHQTGLFRNIVCHNCNIIMRDKDKLLKSNSGIKNIHYCKLRKRYSYQKIINKIKIHKRFKSKIHAICYKYIVNLRICAGHYN